jgi:cell division protein FtsQ
MSKEKIILLEDRIPNFKKQRRKKANKLLILYISTFFLLSLFILYFQSSLSKVRDINIAGNSYITTKQILDWSQVKPGMNYWEVTESEIMESIIGKHEIIKNVSVKKVLPSTINIKINEFREIGYVKIGNNYKVLLENGSYLDKEYLISDLTSKPVLIGWNNQDDLNELATQLSQLPKGIYNLTSEVHFIDNNKNKNTARIFMSNGYEVRVSIFTLADKLKYYSSIVSQLNPKEKGVIHLEVGSYFKKYTNESPIEKKEGTSNETSER